MHRTTESQKEKNKEIRSVVEDIMTEQTLRTEVVYLQSFSSMFMHLMRRKVVYLQYIPPTLCLFCVTLSSTNGCHFSSIHDVLVWGSIRNSTLLGS